MYLKLKSIEIIHIILNFYANIISYYQKLEKKYIQIIRNV